MVNAKYFNNFKALVDQPLPEMRAYFDAEFTYLDGLVNSRSEVMDVGCGPGRTMRYLAPKVGRIVGVERDSRMVEEGRKVMEGVQGNYEFWEKDFFAVDSQGIFDLVFASYNLPGSDDISIDQRQLLLKKMVINTRQGGHTVVSFWKPTNPEWLYRYYRAAGAEVQEIWGNMVQTTMGTFTRFTDQEIKDLADTVGVEYSVVSLTPMFDLVHFRP